MRPYERIDSGPSYEAIFFGITSTTSSSGTDRAEAKLLNLGYELFYGLRKGELMIVD